MNSKRHTTPLEPPAEVAPYFDDEATVLAQPVVPLDAEGGGRTATEYAPEPLPETAPPLAAHAGARPFRRLPLALLLLSVLTGVVIGGAGFYLFQRERRPEPAAPSSEQTAALPEAPQVEATPAPSETPSAEPTEVAETAPEPDAPAEAERAVERAEANVVTPPPVAGAPRPSAEPKKRDDDDDAPAGAPKRGKRAEAEDDGPRRAEGEARPRRVETIVYPAQRREQRREERRAERRERRSVDSVRGIFEGRP